ncbi:MAG: SLATT domain-containing protein [Pseudomonadota bacterium]
MSIRPVIPLHHPHTRGPRDARDSFGAGEASIEVDAGNLRGADNPRRVVDPGQPAPATPFERAAKHVDRHAATQAAKYAENLDDAGRTALDRLLAKCKQVKRARFEAQHRFEAKNRASIVALTLVSILSIAITLYIGIYRDTSDFAAHRLTLEFMAAATSLLVLAFGFIVALGSYQDKALRMQACALALGRMVDEIMIAEHDPATTRAHVRQWAAAYNDIIQQCPYNHEAIDFDRARQTGKVPLASRLALAGRWYADVLGIHAFFLVMLATFWLVVS